MDYDHTNMAKRKNTDHSKIRVELEKRIKVIANILIINRLQGS